MWKLYQVSDIIQSILQRKEHSATVQKELLQRPRVIQEAKTLGRVSGARCDNTLQTFTPRPLPDLNCFSFHTGKMIVLLLPTPLLGFTSNLQNFIQITLMLKMLINVSREHWNTAAAQDSFGPTSFSEWYLAWEADLPSCWLMLDCQRTICTENNS